jgi:hypothetical protein
MTMLWDGVFPGRIYYCTDDAGLGYLRPGSWVHGEVEVVADVRAASSRTMSDPDVILEGWSVPKLWAVWLAMFCSSLAVAAFFARL